MLNRKKFFKVNFIKIILLEIVCIFHYSFCLNQEQFLSNSVLQELTGISIQELPEIIEYIKKNEDRHVSAWKKSYPNLIKLINKYNLRSGCEIGVAFGTLSQAILRETNVKILYHCRHSWPCRLPSPYPPLFLLWRRRHHHSRRTHHRHLRLLPRPPHHQNLPQLLHRL